MNAQTFRPTLYLNDQCPFCLKVRIFLLESGLRDRVDVVEFSPGSAEETATKQMLATHLEKPTVPAAQLAPGEYVADSDAIIARLAEGGAVDPAKLPILKTYANAVLSRMIDLFKENAELKRQIA